MKRKKTGKTKRSLAALSVALVITAMVPNVTTYAETSKTFAYDSDNDILTGTLETSGSENISRLEFYFSNDYKYANEAVSLIDESGNYYHLNADSVVMDGSSNGNTEVKYGGTIPVDSYNMNCVVYYVISDQPVSWTVNVIRDKELKECFVVESEVPENWGDTASAVITKPESIDLYFVDSNASSISSMKDIEAVVSSGAQEVSSPGSGFEGKKEDDKTTDPLMAIIIFFIIVTLIAIVVTYILLKKEKEKKENKRSEEYVKRANAQVKEKKENENEELKDLIRSYDDEYNDDIKSMEADATNMETNIPRTNDMEPSRVPQPTQTLTPNPIESSSPYENMQWPQPQPTMNTMSNQTVPQMQEQNQQMNMQTYNSYQGYPDQYQQPVTPYENHRAQQVMQNYPGQPPMPSKMQNNYPYGRQPVPKPQQKKIPAFARGGDK